MSIISIQELICYRTRITTACKTIPIINSVRWLRKNEGTQCISEHILYRILTNEDMIFTLSAGCNFWNASSDQRQPTSDTPFQWRIADVPLVAHCVLAGHFLH